MQQIKNIINTSWCSGAHPQSSFIFCMQKKKLAGEEMRQDIKVINDRTSKWRIKPKNNCFISILLVLLKINIHTHRATAHIPCAAAAFSTTHTQEWKRGSPSAAAQHKTQNNRRVYPQTQAVMYRSAIYLSAM